MQNDASAARTFYFNSTQYSVRSTQWSVVSEANRDSFRLPELAEAKGACPHLPLPFASTVRDRSRPDPAVPESTWFRRRIINPIFRISTGTDRIRSDCPFLTAAEPLNDEMMSAARNDAE